MDINTEIEIQDLKYEIRELKQLNKDLKKEINTLVEDLFLYDFGKSRELLLKYENWKNEESELDWNASTEDAVIAFLNRKNENKPA